VFRILQLTRHDEMIEVKIEHGEAKRGRGMRETFILKRDERWRLRVEPRDGAACRHGF
jgi:hypothetical protein